MGSHVEEMVEARISRVKAEAERRRAGRAVFAERRRFGLEARKRAQLARMRDEEARLDAAAEESGCVVMLTESQSPPEPVTYSFTLSGLTLAESDHLVEIVAAHMHARVGVVSRDDKQPMPCVLGVYHRKSQFAGSVAVRHVASLAEALAVEEQLAAAEGSPRLVATAEVSREAYRRVVQALGVRWDGNGYYRLGVDVAGAVRAVDGVLSRCGVRLEAVDGVPVAERGAVPAEAR